VALTACGRRDVPVDTLLGQLRSPDPVAVERAIAALGERGRRDPDVLERLLRELQTQPDDVGDLTFHVHVDTSAMGGIENRQEALLGVARVIQLRLAQRAQSATVDVRGEEMIHVHLMREGYETDEAVAEFVRRLSTPGGAAVRAEAVAPSSARSTAWPGDAASFEALLAAPPATVREEGDSSWQVVPWGGASEGAAGTVAVPGKPVVVALPDDPADALLGDAFEASAETTPQGEAVLVLYVASTRTDDVRRFAERHRAHPWVLVVDGLAVARTAAHDATSTIRFPIGTDANARARAESLAQMANVPPLPLPVRVERAPAAPRAAGGPLARALVAVGPKAEGPLAEIARGRGPAAPAALWARDAIVRAQAREGREAPERR
jgi:hypothetical protein